MSPLDVLKPNYMGSEFDNLGVSSISANQGYGVREALASSTQAMSQSGEGEFTNAAAMKDSLRTAKAREFGKTKETVGF